MEAGIGIGVDVGGFAHGDDLCFANGAVHAGGVKQHIIFCRHVDRVNTAVERKQANALSGRARTILVDVQPDDVQGGFDIHGLGRDVLVVCVADGFAAAADGNGVVCRDVAKGDIATAQSRQVDVAVLRVSAEVGIGRGVVGGSDQAGDQCAAVFHLDNDVAVTGRSRDHIKVAAALLGDEDGGVVSCGAGRQVGVCAGGCRVQDEDAVAIAGCRCSDAGAGRLGIDPVAGNAHMAVAGSEDDVGTRDVRRTTVAVKDVAVEGHEFGATAASLDKVNRDGLVRCQHHFAVGRVDLDKVGYRANCVQTDAAQNGRNI